MSTGRRRRIRAHRDELRAQHAERRREVDAEVARIHRFDAALLKVFAWVAIAVFVAFAIGALIA